MPLRLRHAIAESAVLAVACLITFLATTRGLSALSRDDDLLGGMWAVIATIFVIRDSYQQSVSAAVSRMSATAASFVICLIYLSLQPFHAWALAVLIGVSALVVSAMGRPQDAVTAAITTTVILVVAAVSPADAWQQPILRFVDTVVGVLIGLGGAWIGLRLRRSPTGQAAERPTPGI